jgi:hypothetical protein
MEDLTNVVDWSLYGLDPPWGVRWIDLDWLGTWGLLAIRTRENLQELGPGGVLVVRT